MNGRILKFEGSVHAQADRLLPWYVNGTLEEQERMQVEQHLITCVQCQDEAAWLRNAQDVFAEQARRDDASPTPRHTHPPLRARAPFTAMAWRRRERRLAWLAVVQAAVILGLGTSWLQQRHGAYHTLSAPGDKGALLVVVFDPHTREAQMRNLVRAYDARIVGGPTESGAYVLRVPDGHEAATRKALLGSGQVSLVEDLSAGGNP